MNEMNERRSSAEIVAEWRAELEIHDREAQDGDRTWHFTHYIRADPEMFIRAALRELDRLTAERDAARAECDQIRGWMTGYALLREQYAKEYLMRGELGKSDISTVIAQDIAAALNAFPLPDRAALGNESEASE